MYNGGIRTRTHAQTVFIPIYTLTTMVVQLNLPLKLGYYIPYKTIYVIIYPFPNPS